MKADILRGIAKANGLRAILKAKRLRAMTVGALAITIGALALLTGGGAAAQSAGASPVGLWKTIDDETKQPKALVRISERDGVLSGKIEKLFDPSRPNPVCEACTDERKGQPVVGMTILSDLKPAKGDVASWEEGLILDPNNGKVYRARATLVDGGRKLEVRGFIGVALFGRTQTWERN
ncbi:MAG: DUF2147 domain-containing protein [Lautropia sp.]